MASCSPIQEETGRGGEDDTHCVDYYGEALWVGRKETRVCVRGWCVWLLRCAVAVLLLRTDLVAARVSVV